MTDPEADRLTLAQWLSPAFPVGGFAYSHGLDSAMADGRVHDAATLLDWVAGVLWHGAGRADATLLCAVLRGDDPDAVAAVALALCGSRERSGETEAQGAAFAGAVAALGDCAAPGPLPLPVAVGRAARDMDLPPEAIAAQYLFAFAQTLVLAGVRFVPLGQTEGQRILAALRPAILEIARQAAAMSPGAMPADVISTSSFAADLDAMAHETQDVRMFLT